jgi:flagellin
MPIVVNTNSAATTASFNLSKNAEALRKSLARLSSGKRITQPAEDAGGMAVAYKLDSHARRTEAVLNNHQNALSYLQVQDGALETVGKIANRMSELRTMAADITKNNSDVENYSKEFRELQLQLNQIQREKFNGISLFTVDNVELKTASLESKVTTSYEYTNSLGKTASLDYDAYARELKTHPSGVSDDGHIKLNVVNLQHVLKVISLGAGLAAGATKSDVNLGVFTYGNNNVSSRSYINDDGTIGDISAVGTFSFTHIIEKIADARAENGAEQQRVQQSYELHSTNLVNLEAAHGRIMDVDVALESTRYAKHNVLVQASASMTAQANQLTQVALTLLQ